MANRGNSGLRKLPESSHFHNMKQTFSANRGQTPETFLTCCKSEFEPRSAVHHHYPLVKSLSLPLNYPVGPQAWRGFSLFLADLVLTHSDQLSPFPSVFRSLFSTSCERAKSVVRKMSPLKIKGLAKFWDRQFF